MTRTHILIGAAAAALISSAAFAQDAAAPAPADPASSAMPEQKAGDNVVNPPAASAMPMASDAAAPSASAMGADASVTASSAIGPAPAGSVTVTTLTNGPVPDTKANRVKYGQPQSHAGKMSRAAGN